MFTPLSTSLHIHPGDRQALAVIYAGSGKDEAFPLPKEEDKLRETVESLSHTLAIVKEYIEDVMVRDPPPLT